MGLPGIGKSTVAKEAVHYMSVRKYFTGGVIFINLKNISSLKAFLQKFRKVLPKDKFPAKEDLADEGLIDYFLDSLVTKDKFLICLDNTENIQKNDEANFKFFLEKLLEADNVSVILTTTKPLDQQNFTFIPAIVILAQLKPSEAVELFLQNSD